jgi:tetratricopeptide (TPR) repeat protein
VDAKVAAADEAKKKAAADDEAKKKAAADEEAKKKADEDSKKKNVDVEGLKKAGMSQVNSARYKDAIETGKQLIEADPEEATGYFVLGVALQNVGGKWPEGQEQLNQCVRKATKGPVGDCKAAGGHK